MQVEEEAAGHTGLALEPEDRSFGEGQPNTTDLVKVDLYLRIEALVKDSQIQLMPNDGILGAR